MRSRRFRGRHIFWLASGFLSALLASLSPLAEVESPPLLELVARIPLPDVRGRIDHLALDPKAGRLAVAALGNDSVEIVDLAKGLDYGRIDGLGEPQGVLFLPSGKLLVTSGRDATLTIIRSDDLRLVNQIRLREDPDNIRFSPQSERVWIGEGSGTTGALAAIQSDPAELLFEVGLDGHPESFQLEADGPLIYVNVPAAQEVEVVDGAQRKVVDKWKLPCSGNFPMAIDERRKQILVGCRRPATILALDVSTGKVKAEVPAPGDVDDIFIDTANGRAYVSGGEGWLQVYALKADGLEAAGAVPTTPGARTCLFDPASGRLFVAAPGDGSRNAEILVFSTSR